MKKDFYEMFNLQHFKNLVNCKCGVDNYNLYKIENLENDKKNLELQVNRNGVDNCFIMNKRSEIKEETDKNKKLNKTLNLEIKENIRDNILNKIKSIDKQIEELQKSNCEIFMIRILNNKNFIDHVLENAFAINTDFGDGDTCRNKFLYHCFNELFDNYKSLSQVINNQYTKIITRNYHVEEVKYLQVFENGVKYTIKMKKPDSNTMIISLKKTAKPVGDKKTFDMNYTEIKLSLN